MANKARYLWIPLTALIFIVLVALVPWLYGAGKTQATLVASDTALGVRIDGAEEDISENKTDIKTLESKFDDYHTEQKKANTEILRRLPK